MNRIKRYTLVIVMVAMSVFLMACDDKGIYEEIESDETQEKENFVFIYDTFQIEIGAKWENILPKLGEYSSTFIAESCAYQGTDRYYYYEGFEVMTSEIDGEEILTDIFIESTDIEAFNGLKVGMGLSDMVQVMGPVDKSTDTTYTYCGENVNIQVNTSNDKVVSIEYYYVQE